MKENLEIKCEWQKLNHEDYKNFNSNPAVYMWIIDDIYYVGETLNLKKRINGYNHPGKTQWTNIRMKNELDKANEIEFYILNISYLKLNNHELINKSNSQENVLKDSFIRRLVENYFIVKTKYVDQKELHNAKGRKGKESLKNDIQK